MPVWHVWLPLEAADGRVPSVRMLQESPKASVDPKPFIDALSLDAQEQQDSQEFQQLLLQKARGVPLSGSRTAPYSGDVRLASGTPSIRKREGPLLGGQGLQEPRRSITWGLDGIELVPEPLRSWRWLSSRAASQSAAT